MKRETSHICLHSQPPTDIRTIVDTTAEQSANTFSWFLGGFWVQGHLHTNRLGTGYRKKKACMGHKAYQ